MMYNVYANRGEVYRSVNNDAHMDIAYSHTGTFGGWEETNLVVQYSSLLIADGV